MRHVSPALALLACLTLVPVALAGDPPAAGSTSFSAEGSVMTTVSDMKAFADEVYAAKWDLTKAARVDGLVIEKDAAKWTLSGWIFLRSPVRGIRARAIFFGDGKFQLAPPIELERQQVRRFLQQDDVDQPVKQVHFQFNGVDEQQILETLTYSEAEAKKAETENEDCRKWMEGVRELQQKGEPPEELERRRYREAYLAFQMYMRVLTPKKAGWLSADMTVKAPKELEEKIGRLTGLQFSYDPESAVEVSLGASFKHDKGDAGSRVCSFHAKGQYAGDLQWAGTSPYIESEPNDYFDLAVHKIALKLTLTPGDKVDTVMSTDQDVEILDPSAVNLTFNVNPYTEVKKIVVDGKEVEFFQPSIPGRSDLHAPYVVSAIPGRFTKGQRVRVQTESTSKIFQHVDDATWMVKEEDVWFPDLSPDLGDTPPVYDTTIRAPKGWMALANGKPQPCATEDAAPGLECYRYVTNIGIDFSTINLGNNLRADRGESLPTDADKDGKNDPPVPITIWTNATAKRQFPIVDPTTGGLIRYAEYNLSENGPDALGRVQIAHKVYSEWFGPCPYDTLTITPHPKGHGRGSASLLLISQDAFLSNTAFSELASLRKSTFQPWYMTMFLVHEVAHQWWGGAARIRDGALSQWFSEGFAEYGAALVLEEIDRSQKKTDWFHEMLGTERNFLLKDDGYANTLVPLAMGNRYISPENRDGYKWNRQEFMYGKGCMILHSLRMLARARMDDPAKGDELFKKAMRTFISECKGKEAPSNMTMMRSLEKTYGMPLDWFWKQWIFGMGVPKVEYAYQMVPAADGGTTINLRVKQLQPGTPFQFPLAVSLWLGKQELGFDYQWVGKGDTTIKIDLPAGVRPDKLTVNGDIGVLGNFKEVPWQASAAGM